MFACELAAELAGGGTWVLWPTNWLDCLSADEALDRPSPSALAALSCTASLKLLPPCCSLPDAAGFAIAALPATTLEADWLTAEGCTAAERLKGWRVAGWLLAVEAAGEPASPGGAGQKEWRM